MLFFLALILYISSVVLCLVFFIALRKIKTPLFILAIGVHLTFLVLTIFYLLFTSNPESLPLIFPLSFFLYCCSGIVIFGIIVNSSKHLLVKIYFALFVITFPFFIIKPSFVIHALLHITLDQEKLDLFPIGKNIYLQKQSTISGNDSNHLAYKLVQKRGIFTTTLKRDIMFDYTIDSISTLQFNYPKSISIKIFGNNSAGIKDSSIISLDQFH